MTECARCGYEFDHLEAAWVHLSVSSHRATVDDAAYPLCSTCGEDVVDEIERLQEADR